MVVSLGPGKFYGKSLPRPRIYTDIRFSDHRVDPPKPVLDPLLSWASEAHWSMGGLSFTRLRLQGRIEGSLSKLRSQRHNQISSAAGERKRSESSDKIRSEDSPPPAPIAAKRRRFAELIGDDGDDVAEKSVRVGKRRLVKKLGDEFDRVAVDKHVDNGERLSTIARRQILDGDEDEDEAVVAEDDLILKGKRESGVVKSRTSPRFAKRR